MEASLDYSPFVNINGFEKHYPHKLAYYNLLNKVFSLRSHEYPMLKLELHPPNSLTVRRLKKYVNYATSHHVERMDIRSHRYCSLSAFSSNSLRELKLTMNFESGNVMKSDRWTLPNLTTLLLKSYSRPLRKFPESCLICLPALTTLALNQCGLPDFISLPALKTLCLQSCSLPQNVWDFPTLLTLQLTNVDFPEDISKYILALASLENLAIDFGKKNIGCCDISNSQLVNLEIRAPLNNANASQGEIVVWAPKLCNFNATGFFRITFKGSDHYLKRLNVKFWDRTTMYRRKKAPSWVLKQHRDLFQMMFSQLGSAEILSVDLVTLQALSEISDILDQLNSPFYNLKYLKLPYKCKESYISSSVRQYLLGGSPSATIVKT